jgi:hypothetical protein
MYAVFLRKRIIGITTDYPPSCIFDDNTTFSFNYTIADIGEYLLSNLNTEYTELKQLIQHNVEWINKIKLVCNPLRYRRESITKK